MPNPGPEPEEAVPVADADIATRIARAAKRGRGTDRTPTLEQLLSAFGEPRPTEAARRRVRAALELADVDVRPSVLDVAPGERVLLTAPGGGGGRARSRGRALGGLLAVGAILAVAAVAATLAGQDSNNRAGDDLPPDRTLPASASSTTAADTTTATPAATTAATSPADTTTTTTPARQKAKPRKPTTPAAARPVSVRVSAPQRPTFLCVEDGAGKQLFAGTLSGSETFKARVVRLNIGLASTEVKVDGRAVPLNGSPDGLEVSRKGGTRPLPLGRRPCG